MAPDTEKGTGFNRYSYVTNNPYRFIDPDGRYESSPYLLATVPGQASFDRAVTAVENGNYGQATVYAGAMLAEQVLTVATFGQGQVAATATRSSATEVAKTGEAVAKEGLKTTTHGAQRIAGSAATRGGVLSASEVKSVMQTGRVMTQADGGEFNNEVHHCPAEAAQAR